MSNRSPRSQCITPKTSDSPSNLDSSPIAVRTSDRDPHEPDMPMSPASDRSSPRPPLWPQHKRSLGIDVPGAVRSIITPSKWCLEKSHHHHHHHHPYSLAWCHTHILATFKQKQGASLPMTVNW